MGAQAEFKVPLMGKSMRLEHLPGQDPQREYGVVWSACREPGDGWGYVFEFTGKRSGRILAWMTIGGSVYACDGPLASVPDGDPDLLVSRLPDDAKAGHVEARDGIGRPLRVVSRFSRSSRMGAFTFDLPACDLGPYAGRNVDFRTFLAVGFLAFVHLPRRSGAPVPGGLLGSVAEELLKPPLADACDLLVHRVRSSQPGAASGFELYAARLLEEAGSARLRAIAAHTAIAAGLLSSTRLAWLRFDGAELSREERAVVLGVESALNRLILIEDSVQNIDGFGGLYAGYDEGYCSQQDWRTLCAVASRAGDLVRGCERENDLREQYGVQAAQGGEWDVRTRFARMCETLRLPFRLEYRFDVDATVGVVAVECSVPLPEQFPAARWDAAYGTWTDTRMLRGWAASAYALRLSAALASAAFGSGIGIARAYVTVRPGGLDAPAGMSLAFDRIAFMAGALPRIEAGALEDAAIACDPAAVLELLEPVECSTGFLDNGFFGVVEMLDPGLPDRRPPLWEDERALPAPLSAALRADRACELDVLHDDDAELTVRVNEAQDESEDSPIAAMAVLEEIVARLDERERDAAADGLVPLYCSNPSARVLVSLLDGDERTRYRKASDAAFAARCALSRLYRRIGDTQRALEAAEACRTLAPTSMTGYFDAVAALMEDERFDEAETLLRKGMRVSSNHADSSYLCYRLAYALWRQGKTELALACYVAVAAGNVPMAEQAEKELSEAMEQMGLRERPSCEAAVGMMLADGVTVVPPLAVSEALARAALGLADAGILKAAAPVAHALAAISGDDVLSAAASSLD